MKNAFEILVLFILTVQMNTSLLSGKEQQMQNASDRIFWKSFYSKILHKEKKFTIVLPSDYKDSQKQYPVLYIFHGRGRTERSFVSDEQAKYYLLSAEFIIVMPDGDDNWYINSPVDQQSRYDDYICEMMDYVEKNYRISKDANMRGLSGWSMGGYGCTIFAQRHSESFIAVAPIIALLDYPSRKYPRGQSYSVQYPRFGRNPDVWKEFNPLTHVQQLKNKKIYIVTGKKCFTLSMNRTFIKKLQEKDICFTYVEKDGGHSFRLVVETLPEIIDFMQKVFTEKGE